MSVAVLKQPHDDLGDDTYHPWWFQGDVVYADSLGRIRKDGSGSRWRTMRCNNPDCGALALVNEWVIGEVYGERFPAAAGEVRDA